MRDAFTPGARWIDAGVFWAIVLLVLPACDFNPGSLPNFGNLHTGPLPHTSAIFCDIEKPLTRRCASAEDLAIGIRLSEAALALNEGRLSNIGLDDSPSALASCAGQPQAVEFHGAFPNGFPVCLNCSVIGSSHATVDAACAARCYDFFGTVGSSGEIYAEVPPAPTVRAFCDSVARASTNSSRTTCLAGVCSEPGTVLPDFLDPRRLPDPVVWSDLIGATVAGAAANDLRRTAVTTGSYDAGGVSDQWIGRGDAYVEFSAISVTQSQVLGLSPIPPGCPFPCPDTNPDFAAIGFAIMLHSDGRIYLRESGVEIAGPDIGGSWGTFTAGERFRVTLRDNQDGTASVRYSRLIGPCTPGVPCNQVVFYTQTGIAPGYPFRVDASIREQGATLGDVRVVYIR